METLTPNTAKERDEIEKLKYIIAGRTVIMVVHKDDGPEMINKIRTAIDELEKERRTIAFLQRDYQ